MRNIKNVFAVMTALSFAGVSNVSAQEVVASVEGAAVLVKIGNIKSVKDKDGLVKACDFDATYYNRTANNLNNATIELKWTDSALDAVMNETAKEEQKTPELRGKNVSKPLAPSDLQLVLDVPTIESYRQVTVRSNLQTDRCFMLVGDAYISVRTCSLTDPNVDTSSRQRTTRAKTVSNCTGLFQYVSSKDPQYYQEFKKLTPEEQKALDMTAQQKARQEIEDEYQRVLGAIKDTSDTIKEIK